MKFDIKFKSIDYSQSLVDYAQERLEKLAKFEIRPITIHLTFSKERYEQVAQVYINGLNGGFRARASAETLQAALDLCLKKLKKQMEKEKSKVKHHHHFERTHEAKFIQMTRREQRGRRAS